jgi:hypothetical protein
METLDEYVDGLPNLCGQEQLISEAIAAGRQRPVYSGRVDVEHAASTVAVALHMHQPLIPAAGDDLHSAGIISNLAWMMDHQDIGDNHNAPAFVWCYKRMGEFIPQLLGEGREPRVMLEYSGTLLHGMRQMGLHDVFDALGHLANDGRARDTTEWLGSTWGHAVAPSTPVRDYRLHVRAWQHHFAAIFGLEALGRIRGFSPAEMALPNLTSPKVPGRPGGAEGHGAAASRGAASLAAAPRAYCLAEASPLRNIHRRGRTAGTSLDAAARFLARGASGVWLRAVSRLGLLCRGAVYLLVGYLALRLALAAHGRTGAPASSAGAVQAAGAWGVSRWSCSSPDSARTRSPSSSRPCSARPTRPARWAGGGSARCPRGDACCTRRSA